MLESEAKLEGLLLDLFACFKSYILSVFDLLGGGLSPGPFQASFLLTLISFADGPSFLKALAENV